MSVTMLELAVDMRAKVNDSCGSWMVDMENMLKGTNHSLDIAHWKQQYIYRVLEFIKKITVRDACKAQIVPLGSLHHGEPHLLLMEEHKSQQGHNGVGREGHRGEGCKRANPPN